MVFPGSLATIKTPTTMNVLQFGRSSTGMDGAVRVVDREPLLIRDVHVGCITAFTPPVGTRAGVRRAVAPLGAHSA